MRWSFGSRCGGCGSWSGADEGVGSEFGWIFKSCSFSEDPSRKGAHLLGSLQKPFKNLGRSRTPDCRYLTWSGNLTTTQEPADGAEGLVAEPLTLEVPSLDRNGRSLQDLINMVAELLERGIGFTSLHENVDTTTPGGRLVFHVFAALAEFIRELIVIGTKEGLAAARARSRVGGRPSVATEEIIRAARELLPDPGRSITSIAKLLGVSPGTLYNHIPDLRELRAGAVPRQVEALAR
ncbi:recombinase family protein [Stenotrophomonas sp. NPDC087984]